MATNTETTTAQRPMHDILTESMLMNLKVLRSVDENGPRFHELTGKLKGMAFALEILDGVPVDQVLEALHAIADETLSAWIRGDIDCIVSGSSCVDVRFGALGGSAAVSLHAIKGVRS